MSKSFEFTVIERKGEQLPVFYILTPDSKNLEFSMWEYTNIEELLLSAGADIVHSLETQVVPPRNEIDERVYVKGSD